MTLNEVACKGICLMGQRFWFWSWCSVQELLFCMLGLLPKKICSFQVWKMFLKYWFFIYLANLKINEKLNILFFPGILPGITTCYQKIIDLEKKRKEKLAYVLKPVLIQNTAGRTGWTLTVTRTANYAILFYKDSCLILKLINLWSKFQTCKSWWLLQGELRYHVLLFECWICIKEHK